MKKRIFSLFFALLLLFGVLSFTACSGKYVGTAGGERIETGKAGFYSFYIHWQRDYYKELLKQSGYDINTSMDKMYSDSLTVHDAIVQSAKEQYLSFVVVTEQFDALGLELSEEETKEIEDRYESDWIGAYGENGMKTILKELGLSKKEFLMLLSVQAKSDKIIDHFYGKGGSEEITDADRKEYYETNYLRFKYILIATVDDNENALPADEITNRRNTANTLLEQIQNKTANIEDLIPQYSEDYTEITDTMTDDEKATAEESNKKAIEQGIITNLDGVFNQTLHTVYDITVNEKIINKLQEIQVGEAALVEIDNSIWVIQREDINESDSYFETRSDSIFQEMYGDSFNSKYTRWVADLDFQFDENVLADLDPRYFTDLFSEVYNLDETSTESTN